MAAKKSRVFISFVHEDREIAEGLQKVIASELNLTQEVFLSADQSQIVAGHIWLDRIREALESCEVLVLLLSARSLKRAWVSFEAGAVWLSRRPVIPVCIGNMTKGALPQPYAGMQALNLPDDLFYLLQSVHHHLGLTSPLPTAIGYALRTMEKPDDDKSPLAALGREFEPIKVLRRSFTTWSDEIPLRRL